MDIGNRIKKIRINKDMSQFELSKKLNYVNQSQISKIENGDRKLKAMDIVRLSKALEVPISELLT